MEQTHKLFFELIRFSIGVSEKVPDISADKWQTMFDMASEQALLGVVWNGVEKMPANMRPDKTLMMKWYAISNQIGKTNAKVNRAAVYVSQFFAKKGFRSCLLKGQGNAINYPDVHSRNPGDIDIWLEGGTKKILKMTKPLARGMKICYHHTEFPSYKDTEVEVHLRPSFMNNPIVNRRLQRFFADNAERQFIHKVALPDTTASDAAVQKETMADAVCIPTRNFNIVFQMSHISNHFFHEGIGLRQLMDYFFVLTRQPADESAPRHSEPQSDARFSQADKAEYEKLFCSLGMLKIARAVMYVLHIVFGLDKEHMVVDMDENRGRILLAEIMTGGNFGQHDERINNGRSSKIMKNVERLSRDIRLMRMFPGECLWEPAFRLWHFAWRMKWKFS